MHAIIIDDHPLAIAAIRNLLIKNDIGILAELSEGGSAVQRVETLKPDIVIIDVDIPGVNGIQVLETLRKRQYSGISLNRFVGSLTSDQQKLDSLSKQEISVMRYILDGKDNNDIAEKMFISNKTVSTYKSRLMEKLECKSLMDLYTFAQRNKIG
ncbi:LuxR C-terminal-related transcriptional regulator [Escherichia coli]|uniref:LuxR C-terminal-related transcriptional regulator n=1 Tax=Escherichia coli TaxID=562 RepID=UPI001C704FAA|nr:LuxR C-terminal-related transcriptional regulator [Escherichia coli]MBW9356976.1 response regulator [Escherichia coli]